jgi:hypothetical protein
LKILFHNKFYNACNPNGLFTLIKQKGDTIFLKNSKTPDWQILFNFACLPGTGWTTTYKLPGNTVRNYSVMVDSAKTIIENGFPLKQLISTVSYSYFTQLVVFKTEIIERYGWGFLFTYRNNSGSCDGDYYIRTLCYQDNAFGIKHFSGLPCSFSNLADVKEMQLNGVDYKIFPNPVADKLNIQCRGPASLTKSISVNNIAGEVVYVHEKFICGEIDLSFLPAGLYFLNIINETNRVLVKLVKE